MHDLILCGAAAFQVEIEMVQIKFQPQDVGFSQA
jgi:hypothetical protein